jgi:anti-sigma-K factor RskA
VSTRTLPKGHDEYQALAVAWAIDALEPADEEIFETHRDGCDHCAVTVFATLEVAAELAYAVPDIEPPPLLRHRVLAAATPVMRDGLDGLGADGSTFDRRPGGPRRSGSRADGDTSRAGRATGGADGASGGAETGGAGGGPVGGRAAGAGSGADRRPNGPQSFTSPDKRAARRQARAPLSEKGRRLVSALVAAALVGVSAVTTWEVTRPTSAVAPADRVATLSANAGQETVLTIVVRGRRADVVTDGLRPNTDGGTSYYLWGVPPGRGGIPQVVGTFDVTTSGLHSYPVRLTRSLGDYAVLAVSEERAGSTPTAPSSVLARGALDR